VFCPSPAAARYYGNVATRSLLGKGMTLVRTVVPAIVKPMHSLWHEIISFFFFAFAVMGLIRGVPLIRRFAGDPADFFKLILVLVWTVIMTAFGVSSYRRARKISRS
jgi:hypothetical protein